MLTDLDARHAAAAQMYNAAIQRTRDLWAKAEAERERAAAAAQLGSQMLEKAAAGEADCDDKQLLAAGAAAERADAISAIADAKARAALRKQQEAQIKEIEARSAIIQSDYDNAVVRLVDIDDHIDTLKAQLEDAIAAREIQLTAVGVAYRAGQAFNQTELNEGHHRNPLLSAIPSAHQPKVRIPANGISLLSPLKLELYAPLGSTGRRDVVFSLAGRTRREFGISVPDAA
jgi:hypothetical protein